MGGFLKKINPFDNDDEKKKEEEARRAEEERVRAEQEQRAAAAARRAEHEQHAAEERQRAAERAATAVLTSEGKVTGAGLERKYTTKAGDKLEDIAAYFYGDPVHKQRLIDDNPALKTWEGRPLPGGLTINVSEDASRGDAIRTA